MKARSRLIDIVALEESLTDSHPFWAELLSMAILIGVTSILGYAFHYILGGA